LHAGQTYSELGYHTLGLDNYGLDRFWVIVQIPLVVRPMQEVLVDNPAQREAKLAAEATKLATEAAMLVRIQRREAARTEQLSSNTVNAR
jgi:hypothetical protein